MRYVPEEFVSRSVPVVGTSIADVKSESERILPSTFLTHVGHSKLFLNQEH